MPEFMDPMQLARVAALEGALLSMLRGFNEDAPQPADEVTATIDDAGLNVSFLADGMPVGGIGV